MAEIMAVPSIAIIVYFIIEAYKMLFGKKERAMKHIPIVAGLFGGALGVLAFFVSPNILPAKDVFSAIIVGIMSGLSATGTNQIFKQFSKTDPGK